MKHYEVCITQTALKDMEKIYEYIAVQLCSPQTAMKQYNRIADAILTLDVFPERFALLQSNIKLLKSLRRLLVDKFSVFYTIKGDSVVVISVLYSASNIEERLKDRMS